MSNTAYDVICFGESMLRLTPPNRATFAHNTAFEVHVGGSESNVAVGLACLGASVAWVSRLPDTPLGHKVANAIAQYGVDTQYVEWAGADERLGIYYMEEGVPPRPNAVIYDRANSAFTAISPQFVDDYMPSDKPTHVFHTSGIACAVSDDAHEATLNLWHGYRDIAETKLSFDVNYRAKLLDTESAKARFELYLASADLIFVAMRDLQHVFGLDDEPEVRLRNFQERYPNTLIVMTMGAEGAMAITPESEIIQQAPIPTQGYERVGGGDSFAAGFLSVYAKNQDDVAKALHWAVAVASLKYTIAGDMPLVNRQQVQQLVDNDSNTSWR